MSKHASDDLERLGYFLPEDSQHRLKKLCGHMEFLSHLAQPRPEGAEADGLPEIAAGELAVCLELLAEQATQVLDEVSWPAYREMQHEAAATDDETDAAQGLPGEAGARFAFGVTLDQIDALDRLVQTLSACSDVMAAGTTAELAEGTLPQLGQAACDAAIAMRAILDQVEDQRLGRAAQFGSGVREAQAEYALGQAYSLPQQLPNRAGPLPLRGLRDRLLPSGWDRLH